MNTHTKRAIEAHAASIPHEEVCGFIYQTEDGVHTLRCPNISVEDKRETFEMDPADYVRAQGLGRICGIYHGGVTHTNDAFSEEDLSMAREMCLPLHLCAASGRWTSYVPETYEPTFEPYHPTKPGDATTWAIYAWTNTINGKRYVGRSKRLYHRWRDYHQESKRSTMPVMRAIAKYGIAAFQFSVIEFCHPNLAHLIEREEYWIRRLDVVAQGYNLTYSGKGPEDVKWTPEQCKTLSEAKKGTGLWSDERKKQASERQQGVNGTFYGKTHTPETLARIKASRIGCVASESTKEKFRQRMLTHNHMTGATHRPEMSRSMCRSVIRCMPDGSNPCEWDSIKVAASALGVHPGSIYTALSKGHGRANGYLWRYKHPEQKQKRMPKQETVCI